MKPERAQRLERLHRTLLEAEQRELHSARQALESAESELVALTKKKEEAEARRNGSATGAEWQLWQSYVEALEAKLSQQRRRADGCAQAAQQRLDKTLAAQREVRRWVRIVESSRTMAQLEQRRKSQAAVDELASQRWQRLERGVSP